MTTHADRSTPSTFGSSSEPIVRRVRVHNPPGLHARPASILAQRARQFEAEIALVLVDPAGGSATDVGVRVDAKSILDVIVLGAQQGAVLDVIAVGSDAAAAADALEDLFRRSFGMET